MILQQWVTFSGCKLVMDIKGSNAICYLNNPKFYRMLTAGKAAGYL
jgi:hypothetical protein